MREATGHIVFLTPGFPRDESDESCIPALQEHVRAVQRHCPDIRLSVITTQYPATHARYDWHGIPVFGIKTRRFDVMRRQKTKAALHQAAAVNGKITLLHSFWMGDAERLARYFAPRLNAHHVCTLMGQEPFLPFYARRRFAPHPERDLVCLSRSHQETLHARTGHLIEEIIPWGIKGPETVRQDRDFDIVALGSLVPVKDPLRFLRVLRAIADKRPNIKAAWIGDGPMRREFEEQIQSLNLAGNIRLLGHLPRSEAADYLASSRILLHTARYESFCMALVEAASFGVDIVSTPVGIAQDRKGWRVARENANLVQGAMDFLDDPVQQANAPYLIRETVQAYARHYAC